MHDHRLDGMLQSDHEGVTARALRLHLDNSHDAQTRGWDYAAQRDLHHKLHHAEVERLAGIEAAANLLAEKLAEAPPAVVESVVSDDTDRLYRDLHGAREHLCRAQTLIQGNHYRGLIGRAVELIDAVGAVLCPDQWSRFDQPAPTVVDLMDRLESSLAAAKATLGVEAPDA